MSSHAKIVMIIIKLFGFEHVAFMGLALSFTISLYFAGESCEKKILWSFCGHFECNLV